jgi:hypothetical protein
MGAPGTGVRDPGAAAVPVGIGGADGDRGRLHLGDAAVVFPLRRKVSRATASIHMRNCGSSSFFGKKRSATPLLQ